MKRRSGGWPPWLLVLMLAVLWMADANADPATRDMGPTYAADDCVMEIHEHMARIVCADSADNAWIKWDPAAGRYMSGTGSNEVRPQNWFDPNETGALSSFFVASSGSDPDPCPFPNATFGQEWCDRWWVADCPGPEVAHDIELTASGALHGGSSTLTCEWSCG